MDDYDLPEEYYAYGDIDKYEDQIADDLDALNELDTGKNFSFKMCIRKLLFFALLHLGLFYKLL